MEQKNTFGHMTKTLILIALLLLLLGSKGYTQDRETLWIARGLEALKNIEQLEKAYTKNPSDENRFKLMIEQGFANLSRNPKQFIVNESASTRYKLKYDFGANGILKIVYIEWDEEMPYPGTAFIKVKSVPKGYSAVIDSNGDIDVYFDSDNKYYRVLVFPFENGVQARSHF